MNGMGTVIIAALVSVIAGGLVGWLLNNLFGARSLEAMQKRTGDPSNTPPRRGGRIRATPRGCPRHTPGRRPRHPTPLRNRRIRKPPGG